MKADQFIDRLEQEAAVSERLVVKLREKLADSGGRLPASSLADFLVKKEHLTADEAGRLLDESADVLTDEETDGPGQSSQLKSADMLPAAGDHTADEAVPGTADAPADASAPQPAASRTTATQRRRTRPARRKNEWDSPLLLLGGGGLVLLIICGVIVYFLLFRDTGDDVLAQAREAMGGGSYSQAISQYERFLEDFSGHPEESGAKVELAMARLRRATEGRSNYEMALEVAESNIDEVENEPSFSEAHDELATLLPRITRGLAAQAEQAADNPEQAAPLVDLATRGLELCANTKYVPKVLRDDGELQAIRDTLARVERRKQSYDELQQTLTSMEQAIANGDTRAAYEAHKELVKAYPQLSEDDALLAMVANTSTAERDSIHFQGDEQPAETSERASPIQMALTLGNRLGGGSTAAEGNVNVQIDGAVYGLQATDGSLVWRRFVGFDSDPFVQPVGDDLLVRDTRHQELLRIAASDGNLRWRQPIGEGFAEPLVLGERAYVATDSGRLLVLDVQTGLQIGFLQFAQKLPVAPAAGRNDEVLYLAGDHSSLYSISVRDLTCLGVHYVGHSAGSIRVPPTAVANKLAIFENRGVESSRMLVLAVGDDGSFAEQVHEQRLQGLVVRPPLVSGRRLVSLTNLGEMNVFEIGLQEGSSSIVTLATRPAAHRRPVVQHALLTDRFIWVGGHQLAKYAVQPTDNRLPAIGIEQDYAGATFDHPLQSIGGAVVHVRRPKDRRGAAVATTDIASGQPVWETELAVPPAGAPVINKASSSIAAANTNGRVFTLDRSAIGRRVADQPDDARGEPVERPELTNGIELSDGRAVFAPGDGAPWLLTYDPANRRQAARWLKLPGSIATTPTPLAQGCAAPLEIGQVFYIDPAANEPLAAAFQPPLPPQSIVHWLPPVAIESDQCLLADARGVVYLVRLTGTGQPSFDELAKRDLGTKLVSRSAVVGTTAFVAQQDGQLAMLQLPELETGDAIPLSGRATWGPFALGDRVLVATDAGQLECFGENGEPAWQLSIDSGELVGTPLPGSDSIVVAVSTGKLWKVQPTSGELLEEIDTENSLAAGPVRLGSRLILAAHDGTLLVVNGL